MVSNKLAPERHWRRSTTFGRAMEVLIRQSSPASLRLLRRRWKCIRRAEDADGADDEIWSLLGALSDPCICKEAVDKEGFG